MNPRHKLLLLLALCAIMALNYPWLSLFSLETLVFGLPLMQVYLFALWISIILIIRFLSEGGAREPDSKPTQRQVDSGKDNVAK
jgi:energy-coupling factor transporter transmembrane protein EcfT